VQATVTRAEARENLFGHLLDQMQVETRGFTQESLAEFLNQGNADLVLDATHPFAVRITRIAHAVCGRLGMPLVRYERPDWTPPAGTRLVDTFAAAAETLLTLGKKRVFMTIGAKQLKHFAHMHERVLLWARILPSVASLEQAVVAGFSPDRILCLRPPFSREFNRAILKEFRIDTLVTKASGREGGVEEKVSAALDVGAEVVMIRRPANGDNNSHVVQSVETAVTACQAVCFGRRN
jgi:precorrin-6A/cobalt-precorrin-6A reductase